MRTTYSASNNTDTRFLDTLVDIDPASSGSNVGILLVIRHCDLIETLHRDGDAAVNTRRSGKSSMATTFYSERALR